MKATAAHYRMAYLTANQVESYNRVFVLNSQARSNDRQDVNNTSPDYSCVEDYDVFINPEIVEG